MPSVNYRGFTWIDDNVDHSESDEVRAEALAKRWSQLHHEEEQRSFRRQADYEDGHSGPEACENCLSCLNGGSYEDCEYIKEMLKKQAAIEADRNLEIELVEDKLAAIGARMMRPYEHWNEDERYMEWSERDR